jgi:16S rRNA (guanine527-N7)-methyltransferase
MSNAPPENPDEQRAWFAATFNVSRETLERLDTYAAMLTEWQAKFNLVGPATLPHVWVRHFADSAQLLQRIEREGAAHRPTWLDIGSGAGFAGMVIALMTGDSVTLVDSIRKKTVFLETVRDALGLERNVKVLNQRVESLGSVKFDYITARACAPLAKLFDWGEPYAAKSCTWLLLKGAAVEDELAEARRRFVFEHELIPSLTDSRGRIVRAHSVRRRR